MNLRPFYVSYERNRGSARRRGYNDRWDKAAATFKQRHPYCLGCQALGRSVKTDVVDHVIPHKGDQRRFWDTALWQPACRWHHDVIKPRLERMVVEGQAIESDLWLNSAQAIALSHKYPQRSTIGPDGWPI